MAEGIFKQSSGLMAVALVGDCGIFSTEQLAGLVAAQKELGITVFKLSSRQTLLVVLPEEKVEALKAIALRLNLKLNNFGDAVRNVKACCGTSSLCQRMQGEATRMGVRLQERFMNQPAPKDFKISVAGCHRGCTDPLCADFGVVATREDRYDIYLGGRGGSKRPRHGQELVRGVAGADVEKVLQHVLETYRRLAQPGERLCLTIDRVGLESFRPPETLIQAPGGKPEPAAGLADFLAFADESSNAK
ncbi:MAG: nitrite reductase [Syntrophothermus sp.]